MTASGDPGPFVPLPMVGSDRHDAGSAAPGRTVLVVYVRYRDPAPLEFPGVTGMMPGPVFHAAGVLLREDEDYLSLGELAFAEENHAFVTRFGSDMFPAYRHVLTIPKGAILERRSYRLSGGVMVDGGPPMDGDGSR